MRTIPFLVLVNNMYVKRKMKYIKFGLVSSCFDG